MNLHQLIRHQIEQHLGNRDLEVDPDLKAFIASVSETYQQYDAEQERSRKAFEQAKKEHEDITSRLRSEKKLREQSIETLLSAISTLEDDPDTLWNYDKDNLLIVAEYLEYQVTRRKDIENKLKIAIDETKKASSAKSEFLSIMSHEIRSPLNIIIGMAHILKNEPHLEEQKENIDVLGIASNNLMMLINDILDYGKIESGRLELDYAPFDLKELLVSVQKANKARAAERRNKIEVEIDDDLSTHYMGDSVRIGQIVTNLVSNAIKFTSDGQVTILAEKLECEEDGSVIRVGVKDTGIGISREHQQKIFKKFTQARSNTTREYGGTGLGLAITKDLLNIMDSQISIESELGIGSYFYFDLYLPKGDEIETRELSDSSLKDLDDARLLVVDDLEYNLLIVKKILKDWNITLDFASNGEEAVSKIQSEKYDLVLMDLQMPVMDGKDATREVRRFNEQVPIIALTASTDVSIKKELLESGMNDYLSKPFNPDELYKKLEETLNRGAA